ncbi:uncharacterized protein CXQ87_002573 [Candidozyma duobushaemuli]|uniref:Uncharacterized protein n=2 Tax=Candidozyma TaxID=3303203 RepID=A0ABX8I847_9ASCO|nr:uncharacterized protein CXQ87_002573 [[Candida] duobushaemulonis]PVH14439.1 hypothetical protein CXQ87_002573 [[Candida] duobushaemulonis]QWU87388.1 hypothetical protein CA3LBN_001653 [[Candida] haemuloni]
MKFDFSLLAFASFAAAAVVPLQDSQELVQRDDKDPPAKFVQSPAPLLKTTNALKNRYIVVYKDDASEDFKTSFGDWITSTLLAKRDGSADKLRSFGLGDLSGYVGLFDDDILESVRNSAAVKYVEEDAEVSVEAIATQKNAEYGLVRVSHRHNANNGNYFHNDEAGKGVTAYVVDSGIMYDDPEFEGRASFGKSVAQPDEKYDTLGHGTHVAGTIGSKTYGVAKKVDLVSVSVFNTNGRASISDILTAFDWVVKDHDKRKGKKGFRGSTLNMSIGGVLSQVWTDGINAVVNVGIHAVVSAGNEQQDACDFSPGASDAITAGGTDVNDDRYGGSNYGKCVDINAPAVDVGSVGWKETPDYKTGTSMASPHVCGVVSYLLSLFPGQGSEFASTIKPTDFKKLVADFGTKDKISNLKSDTPNVIAYQGGKNPLAFWV